MRCVKCGKLTSNPKFCSSSCAASYNNHLGPKRQKKRYTCQVCGIEVPSRRQFCDTCNPQSVDWTTRTIGTAQNIRSYQINSRIRTLARKIYFKSSKPKKCFNCGYSKHIEICHIRPINEFPADTPIAVVNALDNLVALCPNCHWEFDQGLLHF